MWRLPHTNYMKTILAKIEKAKDGTYSVYAENFDFSGMGKTLEAAKNDMINQIAFFVETAKETGYRFDSDLDGNYEIKYKFDVQELLSYYEGVLGNAALERLTGINQKQIWSYASGKSKPRKEQRLKIETALHGLGNELLAVEL